MTSADSGSAINKQWELSLYELHRTPQEAITDHTEIAVSPRSLHSELMCPICLEMLKNTMTTKECLHRFCQDCIITALRSGNKECPTCRKKLVSKRSLRPDPNFDALISKIYPCRDEYDQHQDRVMAKLNLKHNHLVSSIEEGIKLQTQSRQKSKKQEECLGNGLTNLAISPAPVAVEPPVVAPPPPVVAAPPLPSPSPEAPRPPTPPTASGAPKQKRPRVGAATDEEEGASSHEATDPDTGSDVPTGEIELILSPHPLEMSENMDLIRELRDSSIRYIKTSANCTVCHLSKYLAMRISLAKSSGELSSLLPSSLENITIYVAPTPDNFTLLTGALSLDQVYDKYWRGSREMEMFYSWKKI